MIEYSSLGAQKRLYQIVFAGSHDAGITTGKSNATTQSLPLGEQARAGVRLFDLRIKAFAAAGGTSGVNLTEMKAFHGPTINPKRKDQRVLGVQGGSRKLTGAKMLGGVASEGLTKMLIEAREFVEKEGKNEFLILKFDKCTNWHLIAQACVNTLGACIYEGTGPLNSKTLAELAGKVVVVFSMGGLKASTIGSQQGILAFKNLTEKGSGYSANFPGLQYYGKGGTSINPFTTVLGLRDKVKQNIRKQSKLMAQAAEAGNEEVLGMMYWTTTGVFASIKKRNDGMWDDPGKAKLRAMWQDGLSEFVDDQVSLQAPNPMAQAQNRRAFFPNIVMIDFAEESRCRVIFDLNKVAAASLVNIDG